MTRRQRGIGFTVVVLAWATGLVVQVGCSGTPSVRGRMGPELVADGVIFRYYDPDATKVYVVGDFNNWSVRSDPMIDKNGDGEWTLLYTLAPGVYQYKFVVDGVKWIPDPSNNETVPDGFDGVNSVLRIPATSQ
ncbi:MAG: glycogen-binding domain-containing protein [Candidatus Krumholzibacteria bacterium]|nr:glycogen-binding domain-containing protein [Candidatus Krumholzibacteria bacterium]